MGADRKVIVCDFDGTLTRGDSLHEAVVRCLLYSPLRFMGAIRALLLADRLGFKVRLLPFYAKSLKNCVDEEVLDYLVRRAETHEIFVFSGCPESELKRYVEELIDLKKVTVKGSTSVNLVSRSKAEEILKLNAGSVTYIGNSSADLPCWNIADERYFAGTLRELRNIHRESSVELNVLTIKSAISLRGVAKQLRLYQWVKNCLVFVPLILSRNVGILDWMVASMAFFGLGFLASGTYVINDIVDLDKDRSHPRKRSRPIASGHMPIIFSFFFALLLVFVGLSVGLAISYQTAMAMLCYLFGTLLYSFYLKGKSIVNVVVLSLLFCIRVIIGGVATSVEITPVFLVFCFFVFAALAVTKRSVELLQGLEGQNYKGYYPSDAPLLTTLGVGLSLCSLVLLLFHVLSVFSSSIGRGFGLVIIPVFLYWMGLIALTASRGQMTDDPIIYSLTNWKSLLSILLMFALYVGAHLV